ncbi:MAG: hypothetical protein OEW87_04400 [Flavobacteriaceae bacterium]|nr:hypothetical protein [Flavobacteriaceae bacterium]
MKKIILNIAFSLVVVIAFSQNSDKAQRIKYITEAPDGSIAMTIYDDTREYNMKLESADFFYKYEILDPITSEPLYSSNNKGKDCMIDKTMFKEGTYNLRLFTSSFVITSKITISAARKFYQAHKTVNALAIRE